MHPIRMRPAVYEIQHSPISDNLTPQETIKRGTADTGPDGAVLSSPDSSGVQMRKQKMMDRRFLHWHDGLLDRDRAVFADELIQVVGMSWDGRAPIGSGFARKTMRQQVNQIADEGSYDEYSSHRR